MKKKITALLAGIFMMGISSFAQTPTVTFTATPTSVCAGAKVTFTNTSTNTPTSWTWYLPGGSPSYTVVTTGSGNPSPVTYFFPGTYAVTCVVRNLVGKDSVSALNYITVLPLPKATVMPPSGGICDNAPLDTVYFSMIDTSAGNIYTWLPSTSLSCSTCENPKAFPSVNTVYTISVSNGACSIILHDTVLSGISNTNLLIAKVTGKDSICAGTADTLYVSGGSGNSPLDPPGTSYIWSNGKTTSSIIVKPTVSTSYSCFITTGTGGCSANSNIFMVNVYPLPSLLRIESPDSICYPGSAIITTSPPTGNPYEYIWFAANTSPDTTDIYTVKPAVTTTYTLVTINQGCRFDSVVKIKVNDPPTVIFTGATNLCQYSSTTICAFGGDQYHWSTGQTTSCVNVVPPASITYTLGVWAGACYVDTTFTIIVDTMPSVRFKGDTSICSGDSTTIYVVPGYDYTYLWNTGSTVDSVVVGSLKTGPAIVPGKYIYYLTVTKGACSKDSEQITVKVYPPPQPTVYPLDTTVCEFTPITLTATGAVGGGYYIWTPKNSGLNHYIYYGGDTDRNVATPTGNTVYAVKVCTWGCCKDTSLRLNIIPNVQGAMVCCDTTVATGTPVNLSATFTPGPYSVEGWSPATGLSCTNCANPTATDNATTTYVVTFLDVVTSCFVEDSVTVTIFNCNVFVPNVFSPNGDGVNDVLYVRSLCMKTMDFAVFDRYGNKVYQSLNINDGWDGTYHGKPMEMGTYMWYLTGLLEDGTHLSKSGNVTIVR